MPTTLCDSFLIFGVFWQIENLCCTFGEDEMLDPSSPAGYFRGETICEAATVCAEMDMAAIEGTS